MLSVYIIHILHFKTKYTVYIRSRSEAQETVWVNNECVSDTVILAKSLRTKTEQLRLVRIPSYICPAFARIYLAQKLFKLDTYCCICSCFDRLDFSADILLGTVHYVLTAREAFLFKRYEMACPVSITCNIGDSRRVHIEKS